jgi:flagellar protein FliS
MYNKTAHKQYANVHFTTVDRGKLLLMMYDGGLNFLRHAKSALESKDVPKFAKYLSKSQAIIAELMNTLDFEAGGQIAKDLDRLYDFMLFYLTEANLQKDAKKIQRVIDLLEMIAGAYREVIESGRYIEEIRAIEAAKAAGSTGELPTAQVANAAPVSRELPKASGADEIPGSRVRISL